jgi:hypothetical protein
MATGNGVVLPRLTTREAAKVTGLRYVTLHDWTMDGVIVPVG